jgi:metal-responsive CopG/Arc/MetJ family transcriptional regulator
MANGEDMSGTSRITTRVSIRLPNEVVRTLERRIDGRRSRWSSVGNYLKDRIIYDTMREHKRRMVEE